MYSILRQILFLLPPEVAHHATLLSLFLFNKLGLLALIKPKSKQAEVEVMGLKFPNRIGLAAGLDKNGEYIEPLSNLGFGFIEIGTVTPHGQKGNPKPRLFRLPKAKAIINRMGFNNKGIENLTDHVALVRKKGFTGIIGINIGKNLDTSVDNATEDYLLGLRGAYLYADYITINISSPNTPGLRTLQHGNELDTLLGALKAEQLELATKYGVYKPIAVKVAPDLDSDDIQSISAALMSNTIDALIATNTTLSRDAVKGMTHADEAGGLSGAPVKNMSTEVIRQFKAILKDDVPIIGVGGIASAKDAQEKLDAGASLIQVYSGLIYQGPSLVRDCVKKLC